MPPRVSFNFFLAGSQAIMLIGLAMMLSGCASSATKSANEILNKSDLAYARVVSVGPLESKDAASACGKKQATDAQAAYICDNLAQYELAKVAFWHIDRHMQHGGAPVPKSDNIKERYILQLNVPRGIAMYQEVASTEDTKDCRWIGPTPEFLNGGTGIVTGFLAGLLIVPGVIILSTDTLSAGVECKGWSYRTIVNEARSR